MTAVAPTAPAFDAKALRAALVPLWPGLRVEVADEVDSTNTRLLERARGGTEPAPCLLVAERQTAGRGRQGRAWHAAPGDSLTFSLALPLAPLAWGGLSLAVGLALAEALEPDPPAAGPRLLLKWPNDLWLADASVGGRKLGGVLIETVALPAAASARARWCVVGVGLNLAPPPEVPGGAGLREWQAGLTPARVLGRVAPALLRALRAFESAGFAPLRAAFARRDGLAGRAVYTSAPAGRVSLQGVSEGVADDGRLWLRDAAGTRHAVDSGEVSVRLQSSPGAA